MPTVSVIVLNWNGKDFLKNCLDSLQQVTYPKIEVIVVDNNSSDDSVKFVKKNYPKYKVIENKKNYGFAKGNNIGFTASKGEYVMFLNNDTTVTQNFLQPLIETLEKNPKIGCIQPQMRVMKEKDLVDSVGSYISFTGFLYHFGYRKKHTLKKYNQKIEVFSAKGACILFPRKVLDSIGVFDEDFFIFFEETDLCFRVWLSGYTVVYEPKSVIYHFVGGDTTASDKYKYERRIYLIFKNMNCSYLKNFGTKNLLTIFPMFLFTQLCILVYSLITLRFGIVKTIFSAYEWNIKNFNQTMKKRKFIQKKLRKVSDEFLDPFIKKSPSFMYYYYSLFSTTQHYED